MTRSKIYKALRETPRITRSKIRGAQIAAARMTRSKTSEALRETTRMTRSKIRDAQIAAARMTRSKTSEALRETARMTRSKIRDAQIAAARTTRSKTGEAPSATVRMTRSKIREESITAARMTRSRTGQAPGVKARMTRSRTGQAPRAKARMTRSWTGQAPRAKARMTRSRTGQAPRVKARMTRSKTGEAQRAKARMTRSMTERETPRAATRNSALSTKGSSQRKSAKRLLHPKCHQTSADCNQEPTGILVVDPSKAIASHVGNIKVKSHSDADDDDCWISGLAVLSVDRLLLADRNNGKVKLVNTQTKKLLSELKLQSDPQDVATLNTNQAAVTLPDVEKIVILGVADILTSQREITMSGMCHGIAYSQNRLVVTFWDSSRMEILDLRGNVIRRIEKDGDGTSLFDGPEYVCVSRDGETIYVSDFGYHKVTGLTFDGVVKSVYKDDELSCPLKVCTDHHGNVYVIGWCNTNVHMITADCRKVKVIMKLDFIDNDYVDLHSVSCCQDTNRLFIGLYRDNNVKIYQLS